MGSGADKNDIDRQENEKEDRRDKQNFLDFQNGFPFVEEVLKIL